MWEDSGFEVYETAGKTYVNREMYEEIGAPARRKLEVREVIDSHLAILPFRGRVRVLAGS